MYFFDLDGTLLDSNGIWLDIDIRFLGQHGIAPVPEEYTDYVTHHTFQEAAEYTRRCFSLPLTAEEIVSAWHAMARDAGAPAGANPYHHRSGGGQAGPRALPPGRRGLWGSGGGLRPL